MCSGNAEKPGTRPYIAQRADPYILRHTDGQYYFTATVPAYDRIILRRAGTLAALRTAPETTIWRKHESGLMSAHIWAPELHCIDGVWYVYFAAGRADDVWNIRPYILECTDEDPLCGTWRESGMPRRCDAFSFQDFSLDMTTFSHAGRRYAVWTEKVNTGQKISNLYIAAMRSPTALQTPQVLLSSPDYAWERVGFWVNEAPAFLRGEETVCLTYSASETGACYCMGLLWAPADADLLDPRVWHKSRQPVLGSSEAYGLYGPGHNTFFTDEKGDTICVYHARTTAEIQGDPLSDPNRHTYIMRIAWKHGLPVFDFANQMLFD